MTEISVTPIYAAIIAILMAGLSILVGIARAKTGTLLGDGGHKSLLLAMRRFGNLSEYAAMALLLLLLMEVQKIPTQWLHIYGSVLVALRILHPFVLFAEADAPALMKLGRFISAAGTAALLIIGAVSLLI